MKTNVILVKNANNEISHIEIIPYELDDFDFTDFYKFLSERNLIQGVKISFHELNEDSDDVKYVKSLLENSVMEDEVCYSVETGDGKFEVSVYVE